MSEWVKCQEKMPDRYPVLVLYLEPFFGEFTEEVGVGFYDDPSDYDNPNEAKGWCFWGDERKIVGGGVTHWMPLPAPPKK